MLSFSEFSSPFMEVVEVNYKDDVVTSSPREENSWKDTNSDEF